MPDPDETPLAARISIARAVLDALSRTPRQDRAFRRRLRPPSSEPLRRRRRRRPRLRLLVRAGDRQATGPPGRLLLGRPGALDRGRSPQDGRRSPQAAEGSPEHEEAGQMAPGASRAASGPQEALHRVRDRSIAGEALRAAWGAPCRRSAPEQEATPSCGRMVPRASRAAQGRSGPIQDGRGWQGTLAGEQGPLDRRRSPQGRAEAAGRAGDAFMRPGDGVRGLRLLEAAQGRRRPLRTAGDPRRRA